MERKSKDMETLMTSFGTHNLCSVMTENRKGKEKKKTKDNSFHCSAFNFGETFYEKN